MKWHPSEMHWLQDKHLPHAHAVHLHPIHWLSEHPWAVALLIAGLIALTLVFLARMAETGIRIETLQPFEYQAATPYGGAY